jgi:hypothetical protein
MEGVDTRRQNATIAGLETVQLPNAPLARTIGSGMGHRDQAVRMAHRDRARVRAVEDPRFSHLRGEGASGSGWWSDLKAKISNEFTNPNSKLRAELLPKAGKEALKYARSKVESVGNVLGKKIGVDNLGSMADTGLKAVGLGKKRRPRMRHSRLPAKHLQMARDSGHAYSSEGKWWVGESPMSEEDLRTHVARGGSFWDGVKKIARRAIAPVGNMLGATVGLPFAGTAVDAGLSLAGYGKQHHRLLASNPLARRHNRGGASRAGEDSMSDMEGGASYARTAEARHMESPTGGARRRRAPMSASDGRRKRNEIVRKVMADKGLKMIEASKYVKEHGLY